MGEALGSHRSGAENSGIAGLFLTLRPKSEILQNLPQTVKSFAEIYSIASGSMMRSFCADRIMII